MKTALNNLRDFHLDLKAQTAGAALWADLPALLSGTALSDLR